MSSPIINKFKTILLTFLVGCLVSCSDSSDEVIDYKFEIFNDSGKEITITSYDKAVPTATRKIIEIENNGIYTESFLSRYSEETYSFFDVFEGDSELFPLFILVGKDKNK